MTGPRAIAWDLIALAFLALVLTVVLFVLCTDD